MGKMQNFAERDPTYSFHMILDEHALSFSRSFNINSLNFTLITKGFLVASFQKWIRAWYQGYNSQDVWSLSFS